MLGAQAVARAFPEYSTTIVKVHPPAVHLKDYINVVHPEVLVVSKSPAAQKTFKVRNSPPRSLLSAAHEYTKISLTFFDELYLLGCLLGFLFLTDIVLPVSRRLCFHFVCLLVSRIMQPMFLQNSAERWHCGPRKNPAPAHPNNGGPPIIAHMVRPMEQPN